MKLPDKGKESETEDDGLLSYAAEWHSLTHGVYGGFRTRPWSVAPKELPDNDDVQKEPHYYKGGYVLGTITQAALLGGLAIAGYNVL